MFKQGISDITRALIKSVGQLSSGVQLATEEGLNSGIIVDYICQNKPRGRYGIGILIDWFFIRNKRWETARLRKKTVERFIHDAIDTLSTSTDPIHLLDLACGPASTVIHILQHCPQDRISAHCQDINARSLSYAQDKAYKAELNNITFGTGNAFDFEKLSHLNSNPNIILCSGFYDLVNDDEQVKASISHTYEILPHGGAFITSIQTAQEPVNFYNDIFSRPNKLTVEIKCRSAQTMRNWLKEAGFIINNESIDRHGINVTYHAIKI